MALITTAAREELIALFVGMFKAAPGANNLSAMVASYEGGQTTAQIAATLALKPDFATVYPGLLTAQEFADTLVANLLGADVSAAASTWSTNWVVTQLQAGMTRSAVIATAVTAIRATANTNYTDAKTKLANKVDVATYYSVVKLQSGTTLGELQDVVDGITKLATSVTLAKTEVDDDAANASGLTYTLTTGVDTVAGTIGNDTINSTDTTATGLDSIDGNAGKDTLNYNDVAGAKDPAGLSIKNVETVIVRSSGAATVTSTATWTGVETLKVAQGTSATVVANGSTALDISGVTGAITGTAGTGAITAVHTAQAALAINLEGGAAVTATLGGLTTGTTKVGQVTLPTGAVAITSTGAASVAATDLTLGQIWVDGGTTVTVNQTATSSAAAAPADATGATHTQSLIDIDGGAATTTVTVNQSAAVTEVVGVAAVAGVFETDVITFTALAKGGDTEIGGLKFTASKDLTAAQVAAAFASLKAGTTQGTASAANGIYSGTLVATYASGTASVVGANSVVTFTAGTAGNATDLATTNGGTDYATVKTDGSAATTAVTGVLGVVGGKVNIDDIGTGKITTVSLSGFGAGTTINSKALSSLTLASSSKDVVITNGAATTLALSLNTLGATAALTAPDYTTINITTTTGGSTLALTGAAATTLTIAGDKSVTLSGATLAVLASVTVSGSAGAVFDTDEADTITSFNAGSTSGAVTAFIEPTKSAYTGGTGADTVTLTAAAPTKAISLGAGDDRLTLAATTTTSTAALSGGDGTDTLSMAAADAVTASATETFEGKFDGFEKLTVGQVSADGTVNLANLDDINWVTTGVVDDTKVLTISKMGANGTVALTAAQGGAGSSIVVTLGDATGTADTLNLTTTVSAAAWTFTKVTAAGVETLTLAATDSVTTTIQTATVALTATAATSLTITGNGHVTLDAASSYAALATLNASAMTGNLTATTNGTVAQTITAGGGADVLTGNGTKDVLNGGAGNDTLIVGNLGELTTLTGGAGADTFNVALPTNNVNGYATITDLAAGDKILFASAGTFVASAVTLGDTAVFQDFANAAINLTNNNDLSWFQYGGNTYIIENNSDTSPSFVNGTDTIVKISGLVDLSTASLSSTAWTLLIV